MKLRWSTTALVAGSILVAAPAAAAPGAAPAKGSPTKPAAAPALVGDYVSFPAAGVRLRSPVGLVRSERWTGFEQDSTRASVMVVKIAGPYAEVSRGFTPEHMKPRGMTLVSKKDQPVDGQPGILVHFTMSAGGTSWDKWALVFGDPSRTVMVTGTFPVELRARLTEPVKASLLSTRLERGQGGDDLPFTLTASPRLKQADAVTGALSYALDGRVPLKSPEQPLFIAAPSLSKTPVPDPRRFAEDRLRATEQTRVSAVTSHEPITVDGLEGYETVAEAADLKSGTPLVLYQVMLFDAGRYYVMQGLVGAKLREAFLPEFKMMARSFKRKPKAPLK